MRAASRTVVRPWPSLRARRGALPRAPQATGRAEHLEMLERLARERAASHRQPLELVQRGWRPR